MIEPEKILEGIKHISAIEDKDVAIWMLEKLIKDYPHFSLALDILGNLYAEKKDKKRALHYFETAMNLDPLDFARRKRFAEYCFLECGDTSRALNSYKWLLKQEPWNLSVLRTMGHIYFLTYNLEKAIDCFEKILSVAPEDADAMESIRRLKERLRGSLEKGSLDLLYEEAQNRIQEDNVAGAVAVLLELIEKMPSFAPAHNDLGVLYFRQGETEKALKHYEKAVMLYPKNPTFLKNMGDFYIAVHSMFKEAYQCYGSALDLSPDDEDALFSAAYSALSLENHHFARKHFNRILRKNFWNLPANDAIEHLFSYSGERLSEPAIQYLSIVHQKRTSLDLALERSIQSLQQYPDFIPFYNIVAMITHEKGDHERTLHYYDLGERLQHDRLIFQKRRADFLIELNHRLDLAYEAYLLLIEKYPGDIDLLLTIGHLCRLLKRCHEAEIFFQRILAIDSDNRKAKLALSSLGNVCEDRRVLS